MGYANIQADSNFYRQSLNADGIKDVTGPYTSLYEDVFRAITVTTDSVVSVTSYVGDSLSSQFLLAGTEIYGLFSSVTIHSGNAILHLAGASYISEIVNQYSASGIPLGFYEEGTQCLSQKISALLTQGVFDDASWVMVPSQYEEDWVRAFKPTSTLGDLAFTRSSDATFTDSTGVVRRSPWNLVTFSEQFDNAIWGRSATTVSINSAVAPNGTLTADTLTADGTNTFHGLTQVGNSINGVTYTQSIYAKRSTNNFIQIVGTGAIYTSGIVFANFDLLNGTLGSSGGGAVSTITNVGNGWYRCTMTATATATGSGSAFFANIIPSATSARAESSTLTTSVFVWGAQLAEGTEALPYFATTDRLNVPRLDYSNADGTLSTCPRLLLEPQRTNSIRNSSMVGAVAGSPGTLPTNWTQLLGAGLTRTIVGTGTENGLPYVDVRYNGTATGTSVLLAFETVTGITAANGQVWTGSFYLKTISLPNPPNNYRSLFAEYTSAGVYVRDVSFAITPTSNLNRFSQTETLAGGATTARVVNGVLGNLTNGAAYDFTIRIAAPQMELGAYATTWVPTTTAAVTRIADAASKTGVSSLINSQEGVLFAEIQGLSNDTVRLAISDGTNNNNIYIELSLSNASAVGRVGAVNQFSIISAQTLTNNNKIAIKYKTNDFSLWINGVQVGTDTSGSTYSINTLNAIRFDRGDGGIPFYGNVRQMVLFPTALTNAQLAELTTL
jgi:hypothetical protein